MDWPRVNIVFWLVLVLVLPVATRADEPAGLSTPPPQLTGGYLQLSPGILQHYSDADLEAEVSDMHGLGMRSILIHYATEPNWAPGQTDYVAYTENRVYPVHPAMKDRDPFAAVFRAANRHGMRVYLGGMLLRLPFEEDYAANVARWSSPKALRFRKELIHRFGRYDSFAGYYVPNEPDFYSLIAMGCDPAVLLDATEKVVDAIKSAKPGLAVVMPIGLYLKPDGKGGHVLTTRDDLDAFWRPWVDRLDKVDAWMVIDGLGTELSVPEHTAMAQNWARALTSEYGKAAWTVVENARMYTDDKGRYHGEPFMLDKLLRSLSIAAPLAEETITFDYLHYMSRRSHKPEAVRLFEAYRAYVASSRPDQQPRR